MAEKNRVALLNLLVARYADLKRRLTKRLGSADLAADALQGAYVRMMCAEVGEVRSPNAYLFRVAMNVAADRRKAERGSLAVSGTEAFLDAIDDAPGPARIVEARSDIEALKRAIAQLPARRRQIVIAACMEEIPRRTIAKRLGISVRTVQAELKEALQYCASCLDGDTTAAAAPRPAKNLPERPKPAARDTGGR